MKALYLAVSLAVLVPIAGCIGSDDGSVSDPMSECVSTFDLEGTQMVPPDHDPIRGLSHEMAWDFETRNVRTCSLPAIGHHTLHPSGDPHKYLGEIDMRGDLDLGVVAVLGNQEGARVYILDISDRANPEVLSFIDQDNTYLVDVKISDDGALLFTASQNLPTNPEFANLPELTGPTGFSVYDISDPAAPRYLMTQPDTQYGCHMLSHEILDGQDVLFCVSQQIRAYRFDRVADTVVVTGFIDHFPEEGGLPLPSGFPVVGDPTGLLSSGPHDMTVRQDEVDGRTYAIVSHWGAGLRIVDVTELPIMTEVGSWKGEGATHYAGNVHTAMMFWVGEERYIIASPEYTTQTDAVPSLWVFDANDLSDLQLIAEWYHPGEHASEGLFLTTHQWQVAPTGPDAELDEVQIYLTYNHAGVWVLDFETILQGDNLGAILGYNLARPEIDQDTSVSNAILSTWDVNVVDGYIYGSDRATGLWVFHYAGDPLGDPRYTGFA